MNGWIARTALTTGMKIPHTPLFFATFHSSGISIAMKEDTDISFPRSVQHHFPFSLCSCHECAQAKQFKRTRGSSRTRCRTTAVQYMADTGPSIVYSAIIAQPTRDGIDEQRRAIDDSFVPCGAKFPRCCGILSAMGTTKARHEKR